MKKHLRWIIAIIVLAVMGVAYYYYLANKPADKDATESVACLLYTSDAADEL